MHPSLLLLWTWCVFFQLFAVHPHHMRSHRRACESFQEAPVVARASLFLECARFVHRCNRGNWPEWMKGHHVNLTKRGLSRGRSPIVGNKRNQKLQWSAAKHFCQWGDVSGSPTSVPGVVASVMWRLSPRPSAPGSANSVTLTARVLPTSWATFLTKRPNGGCGKRTRRRTIWTTVSPLLAVIWVPVPVIVTTFCVFFCTRF